MERTGVFTTDYVYILPVFLHGAKNSETQGFSGRVPFRHGPDPNLRGFSKVAALCASGIYDAADLNL